MTGSSAARTARAAMSAATVTWVTRRALDLLLTGDRWTRTNHRGEPVSLLEGPAVATGLLVGSFAGGPARAAAASSVAVVGAATFGLVDDLSEGGRVRKGLRGHLGALARGELTTGGLKVLGIGATSLVAAAIALGGRRAGGGVRRVGEVVTAGALIAASANLINLFDLRPGRALKAGALGAVPALPLAGPAAACLGAAAAALGPDLAERDMLGDSGANALGAAVGTAAVLAFPPAVHRVLLAAVVGLTLASERVSFTEVIERTPALRAVDRWGRRQLGDQR